MNATAFSQSHDKQHFSADYRCQLQLQNAKWHKFPFVEESEKLGGLHIFGKAECW